MIPTQGQQRRVGGQNIPGLTVNGLGHLVRCAGVEGAIAIIDNGEFLQRRKIPTLDALLPGQAGRGRPNAPGTESGARSVGGGQVKGHAQDGYIHPLQIPAVTPAHETDDTAIGGLIVNAAQTFTGQGKVGFHGHGVVRLPSLLNVIIAGILASVIAPPAPVLFSLAQHRGPRQTKARRQHNASIRPPCQSAPGNRFSSRNPRPGAVKPVRRVWGPEQLPDQQNQHPTVVSTAVYALYSGLEASAVQRYRVSTHS